MQKLRSLERLEEALSSLPSIGSKSAERMAFAMLDFSDEQLNFIASAIKDLKKKLSRCPKCGMIIENNHCPFCEDEDRDISSLLVVSYPKDAISIEKTGAFKGLYHILNGEIALAKGIHIEDLNINSLFERIDNENIKEVVIATNPTISGETTALYIAKKLEDKNIKVTRLAYGLQMGGNLDYVDPLTLSKALEGRQKI